jgi:hypothetical protein
MKIHLFTLLLPCLLISCVTHQIPEEKTISSIISEISDNKDHAYEKRVVVSGWAKDGFECTAIFETKDDLINRRYDKGLWVEGGLPLGIIYPDYDDGYIYRIAKVKIEGTVRYKPRPHIEGFPDDLGGAGHMGLWKASLINNIITVESQVEALKIKTEPNQAPQTTIMAVTPAASHPSRQP